MSAQARSILSPPFLLPLCACLPAVPLNLSVFLGDCKGVPLPAQLAWRLRWLPTDAAARADSDNHQEIKLQADTALAHLL
eukprot:1304846-Rhodomonas_salina.1